MAYIAKSYMETWAKFDFLLISAGMEETDGTESVSHGVERYVFFQTGTFSFPVTPFCLKFLNVGTVAEHNTAQIAGGEGGNNISVKSVLI